ncbi:MAG TPA: protease pro-enzyme activation domain-containing protein [Bryobacteraceae bacterium]|nr:protease pro-enzyme activation domain-containing protein [Bryobacteraceae bacterium]
MLQSQKLLRIGVPIVLLVASSPLVAAAPDRVTRAVDANRTRVIAGHLRRQAQPQFDQGPVDESMRLDDIVLLFKPSAAQQADLDRLLTDQQNPSSPQFRQWLTPEEFGNRFGLSAGDHSKVVAWLTSQGLHLNRSGRARNWVSFSGTAGQVSKALHTPIHRYQVNGVAHFANAAEPSVPEAFADVAGGFLGLDDFKPISQAKMVPPGFNSGSSHFLVPEDYATIYNIAPLYKAGFDGTGQSIAVVGQSDVLVSDLRAFRTRYNLPANDPKMLPYSTTDPGFTGDQGEGNLDLEWASAIAPNATIYYVYGPGAFTAIIAAVDLNVAPIVSSSYLQCEVDEPTPAYRAILQQGNAQGITIVNASGDSGAAGICDPQGVFQFATKGKIVNFPASVPEVTGVGGTQFVEGTGTYWATTNSPNFGSALSYIPEAAWNESGPSGLNSTGGGASVYNSQPVWQSGPGVPTDGYRHVPDVSLTSAGHDAYEIVYQGSNIGFYGTSAATPSFAGILALLNQYQVSKGFQKQAGLGNINPQLYRMAQSTPTAFHDITAGNNIVPCLQGSPDCSTGSFGYPAAAGYDLATGLGSIDANNFVTLFNTKAQPVTVVLSMSAAKVGPNDTVALTAGVYPVTGGGAPTGTVSFASGTSPLGSADLITRNGQQVADLYFPAYLLQGTGAFLLTAQYSGDAVYNSGGTSKAIQLAAPAGSAAIIASWPSNVFPNLPDAQGLSWSAPFILREAAGVAARITSFVIDGVAQPLSQYFPQLEIAPGSTNSYSIVLRNLVAPVTKTFVVSGVDAAGQTWSRQFPIIFNPAYPRQNFYLTATPLIVTQNPAADPSCQWAVQVNLEDLGGFPTTVSNLSLGSVNATSRIQAIFGTERLYPYGSLQGTLCFGGITPPASDYVEVSLNSGFAQEVAISFAGPPANPSKISASPATLSLSAADAAHPASANLNVGISDKTQTWTASIFPQSRTTSWLTLSQYSGTGPAQISLAASGAGFEPGVYRATIVVQSQNAMPQWINVPVMFVLGSSGSGNTKTTITAVVNSATNSTTGSPGELMTIYGTNLSPATTRLGTSFSSGGVSVTVNGMAAEMVYVSPTQINIEVPFEVGVGPAVLGVNNNGQIAAWQLDIQPSAPGIFSDTNGFLVPQASASAGSTATLFVSGAGEVTGGLPDGFVPSPTAAGVFKPALPLTVTVGGVNAFIKSTGIAPLQQGIMEVDFLVPAVPAGSQPVVVTVNGVASPAAKLTVQ